MRPSALASLVTVLVLTFAVAPTLGLPDQSRVARNPLKKEKCTGYCTDHTTCGVHDGCCCYAKFNFCFEPSKGEKCEDPVTPPYGAF
ncbi:hypothetical protein B0H14DRAFT_2798558 [Mycena olivaceomarginata]|nr:hypothetical protein B0H14DRAFT_2798558 [Mycena olivaceomarginata]